MIPFVGAIVVLIFTALIRTLSRKSLWFAFVLSGVIYLRLVAKPWVSDAVWIWGSWLLMAAAVITAAWWLWWATRSRPSAQPDYARATKLLAPMGKDGGRLHLLYWSNQLRPFALTVESIFRLAGWEVHLADVPQDVDMARYFSGVEIAGINGHLAGIGAEAIRLLGRDDVRTRMTPAFPHDHPNSQSAERALTITIGYPG